LIEVIIFGINISKKKIEKQIANKLDIKLMNSALYCNRGTHTADDRTAVANTPHPVSHLQNYKCSLQMTS